MLKLNKKLNFTRLQSRTGVLFGFIGLMMSAQTGAILIALRVVPVANLSPYILEPSTLIKIFFSATFMVALLLVWSQQLLVNEKANAQAIAEHMNDGILFLETDSVTYANPLVRKLLRQELGTISLRLSPEIANILTQTNISHAPVHYETNLDKKQRHFLVSKIDVPSQRGSETETDRQIYVFQDVTFLRESEEAKVSFIGQLSHEIKTPITSLTMALSMLERTGFDPELIRIANADVARMRGLLEDLLNISKLKLVRDPNSIQKREVNFTSLVKQSVRTAMVKAKEKDVTLNFQSLPNPKTAISAEIDPTKISWVLSTMLNNAIENSFSGKQIDIILDNLDSKTIFSVGFEQGLELRDPTGYGIARDIIEAHSGTFDFQDKPGKNSLFKFSLQTHFREGRIDETNLTC